MLYSILILSLGVPLATASTDPSQGTVEQSVGRHGAGSLINDSSLEWEGPGLLKLHRMRNRHFGTSDLFYILRTTAERMAALYPEGERMQIGDISQEGGGRISGHGSHQSGLDADLGFYRINRFEQDPNRNSGFPELFVKNGKVTDNFDTERNWEMLRMFVETGRVNRMFIGAALKQHFCALYGKDRDPVSREVLRRLRPLVNHDNHLHLRITCPAASPRCVSQPEVPQGTGCQTIASPNTQGDEG